MHARINLGAGIARIRRERIACRRHRDRADASPVTASQRRTSRSAPPVSIVRLSGRNATDHTGRPGPTSVRASLRSLRSMTATEPRMPAAATSAPSADTRERDHRRRRGLHLALHGARAVEEIHNAVRARRDDLAIRRDADRARAATAA